MKIESNNTNEKPAVAPPIEVTPVQLNFAGTKPRDNGNVIGMLSKYTKRADLSQLISDRNAW